MNAYFTFTELTAYQVAKIYFHNGKLEQALENF